MQKPNTRSSRRDVPRPMTPILPQVKDRDAFVTNVLDIVLDVADLTSLRRDASRNGSSVDSLSGTDQSDLDSDTADKISVRSSGGKSVSFVDKNKISVRTPVGTARKIQTVDIGQLSSSKKVQMALTAPRRVDVPNPNKHLRDFMMEMSEEATESVQKIEVSDIKARNRQAINARIQRKKKKEFVATLEKENEQLKKENAEIRERFSVWDAEKSAYEDEIAYLKSVLANQSALSSLIKNIEGVETVNLSTSFSRKRQAAVDHDYSGKPAKKAKSIAPKYSAGVCLHVADKNKVSLEFCSKCAKDAL
ncbi:uncharacterized protein LOC135497974 [Lineus longissimus]|uniref:uncharacterized protein LOC135497974 n=1 Tax=Lineus longissimus TaxID=88925 RepID=UPI00315DD57B